MRIGLVDVDGHNFPNLPLMKLSAWHKARGDEVGWALPLERHGRVYMSKVFTNSPGINYPFTADEIVRGGTGYGLDSALPPEVESAFPDYGLYPSLKSAYGFLTRGCPRRCPFCVVSAKEGAKSIKVSDLSGFWSGQGGIKLLDANLLACAESLPLLGQLASSGARVDFTQGLDIRLMTEEAASLIMACRISAVRFAWDTDAESAAIRRKLGEFKRWTGISGRRCKVYMLVNCGTPFEFDLWRVDEIRGLGFDPFVMVYNRDSADAKYRRLQRWVNNKRVFNSCPSFSGYVPQTRSEPSSDALYEQVALGNEPVVAGA